MSVDLFSSNEPKELEIISETPPEEEVGYKKPPKSGQFKSGQSGNPKGRPKGAKSLKTRVENVLNRKVTVRTKSGTKRKAQLDVLIEQLTNKSINGDTRATAELLKLLLRLGLGDQLGDDVEANFRKTSEVDEIILQRLNLRGQS